MQPDARQPQQTVVIGQNTQFANNPYTASQVVYVQNKPSVAPTFIGILTIIYGVGSLILSLIGLVAMSLFMDPSSELYDPVWAENEGFIMISGILSLLMLIGCIIGGVMIIQRKKMGIYITWGMIGAMTLLNVMAEFIAPGLAGIESNSAVNILIQSFCGGLCAVLVAIPLMDAGSNME